MNRKGKIFAVGLLILTVVILIWWQLGKPSKPDYPLAATTPIVKTTTPSAKQALPQHTPQTAQAVEAQRQGAIAKVQAIFKTPITFYGRVIDQNGDPVVDANVEYGVIDKFYQSGSDYSDRSDANGYFSLSGVTGAVLTVGVGKKGYYHIHGKSNGSFGYGMGPDTTRKEPPTKDNPAVFVLQKMGVTEPIIRTGGGQIDIPPTGNPLNFNFQTGRAGAGDLQIQTWTSGNQRRFDWRYRLSIPGGGIVEKKGQFDFEAPADGYQPFIEMNFPANEEQWVDRLTKEYFAKLPGDKYARFSITIYAGNSGDRNFAVIESYLNPKSGSRNLEFDPAKATKTP